MSVKKLYDEPGFWRHCKVVEVLFALGSDPHTNHHIRGAIRAASEKVHNGKTKDTKTGAHYMSVAAGRQMRSKACNDLVVEHIVPVSVIRDMVFALPTPSELVVGELIRRWTLLSIITKAEHELLREAKLYHRMPPGWSQRDCEFARYEQVGIDLIRNEYAKLCASKPN